MAEKKGGKKTPKNMKHLHINKYDNNNHTVEVAYASVTFRVGKSSPGD